MNVTDVRNLTSNLAPLNWARLFKALLLAYSRIKSKLSCQFGCLYETDSLPRSLNCTVEHKTTGLSFSPFKLVLVAGSKFEMTNLTNPGLA